MKAVILAGGFGKRLRPLTADKPKPLVELCGKPIIEFQIEYLKKFGVNDIIVLAGYKWEKLIERLGSGRRLGVNIAYVVEDEPLGTGGALRHARSVLEREEAFIVMNGDIVTNIDVLRLYNKVVSRDDVYAGVALVPMKSPYGVVKIQGDRVVEFIEKPLLREYLINAGIYVLKPIALDYMPEKGDLEKTAFPRLAREGRMVAEVYPDAFWKSIDTVKDLEEAEEMLKQYGLCRA